MSKKHKKQKRNKQQNQSRNQATDAVQTVATTAAAILATMASPVPMPDQPTATPEATAQDCPPNVRASQNPDLQRGNLKDLLPEQHPSNSEVSVPEAPVEAPLPPAGRMRSRAIYKVFQELFQLARSCTLKEHCYANDKERMCNLRDQIDRLRQNDCEFDSLVAETTQDLVVQMKRINYWGDRIYDLYRALDSIDGCERKVAAAADKLMLG